MKYRYLGVAGPKVSEVGLGGDTFGSPLDEADTRRIIDFALDLGINYIDTADVYGKGMSETLIGKAIKSKRSQVLIGTKFGLALGKGPIPFEKKKGLGSRNYIMKAVDASLKKLDTDYIDLYQLHMPDPTTPIEETLRALDEVVKAGKVRYLGCSNLAAWQLCEAIWTSKTAGLASFVSIQPRYNLLYRKVEEEIAPCCEAYNIGIIPWFPLASGFLTGKYRRNEAPPAGTRFDSSPMMYKNLFNDADFNKLEKLEAFASQRNCKLAALALAWLLAHPWISTIIPGATKTEQVLANVKAAELKLSAADMAELDAITIPDKHDRMD